MKLHRTTGAPDWAALKPSQRNRWQRLAANTAGIVTPPNVVTAVGLVVVLYGLAAILQSHYWTAFICLGIGRLLDVVDGWLAELTGTKSPLGETLDASVDKIGTLLTVVALLINHTAPWWVLTALAAPQVVISIIVLQARATNRRLHPSRIGKLSMAVAWLSLFGLVCARALSGDSGNAVAILCDIIGGISVVMGCYAAAGYTRTND